MPPIPGTFTGSIQGDITLNFPDNWVPTAGPFVLMPATMAGTGAATTPVDAQAEIADVPANATHAPDDHNFWLWIWRIIGAALAALVIAAALWGIGWLWAHRPHHSAGKPPVTVVTTVPKAPTTTPKPKAPTPDPTPSIPVFPTETAPPASAAPLPPTGSGGPTG